MGSRYNEFSSRSLEVVITRLDCTANESQRSRVKNVENSRKLADVANGEVKTFKASELAK